MERTRSFLNVSQEIRQQHNHLRKEMTPCEVQNASEIICKKLAWAQWYKESTWIYGYYPLGNEVDIRAFLQQALSDGKHVALPRMEKEDLPAKRCCMNFYEIHSLHEVESGGFGVLEPTQMCSLVEKEEAVVLVPGVVFDKEGNRYGYGKGYYDRYFARFPKLYKIGIAYTHQMEDSLSVAEWDIRMDDVYTE